MKTRLYIALMLSGLVFLSACASKAFAENVYESIVDYVGYFSSQSSAVAACNAQFPSSVCSKEWGEQDPCKIVRAGLRQFPGNDGFILYGCDTILSHDNANNLTVRARDTSWYVVYNNRCSTGTKINELTGACDKSDKYTIKLSPVTAEAYGNYLTAIEPDGITRSNVPQKLINQVKLVAEVKDQDGNPVNAAIKLKVTALEGSGGHDKDSHTERNPSQAGKLKVGALNSDTINIPKSVMVDGIVEFEYAASAVSGDHKIEASCSGITCKQIGKDSVWVGIQDLQELPFNSNYTLIGSSCHHEMNNHYATKRVIEKVQGIARLYRSRFPDDPILRFNDISLERGGLFDAKNEEKHCDPLVKADWTLTHNLHRTGEDVDVRANKTATAIPEKNYKAFKQIARRNGCYAEPHKTGSARHYHLHCTQKQGI